MADRFELGAVGAILVSGIATVYSYAAGLGVGTVLLSVVTGALLGLVVQTRTQRAGWRREVALRKVDEIFGPLFNEMTAITKNLADSDPLILNVSYTSNPTQGIGWLSIKASYQFYLIEEGLRKRFSEFYDLLDQFESNQRRVYPIIDGKFFPRLREAFGDDVQGVTCQVSALNVNSSLVVLASRFVYEPVLSRKSVVEFEKEHSPGYTDYRLELSLQRGNQTKPFFGRSVPNAQAEEQFNKIVADCGKEVAKDSTILLVQEQASQLKKLGALLLEELKQIIEKPWNY